MRISIITINYNDVKGLEKTMTSVFGQTYANIEYIVIDGGSTDGSKDYIAQYDSRLGYWVSEPDKGIYNAMNKGIDKATGDYLLFLNSGDYLVNSKVVEEFVDFKPVEDLVYGDSSFMYPNKDNVYKKMPDNMEGLMIFYRTLNHQSIFHKHSLFNKVRRYDENYKMLADWAFYNNVILIEKGSYRHINLLISNYDTTGYSSNPDNAAIMEQDRNRFYSEHVDYFIPLMLENYKMILDKYNKLKASKNQSFIFKIKKSLRNVFKRIKQR